MSRIGKQPIAVPGGVKVALENGTIRVEGPKGKLSLVYHPEMRVEYDEGGKQVRVGRPSDERPHRSLHGLTRSLIANMVEGVTKGYEKRLEIVGVGYQAQLKGKRLALSVGYANTVEMDIPEGLVAEVPDPTHVVIRGADKQAVGQFAAEVRAVRKPEPYKGKGVRYQGEQVRRKAGKAFTAAQQ